MTSRTAYLLPLLSFVLWTGVIRAGEPPAGQASQGQTAQGKTTSEQAATLTSAQAEARATAYLEALRLNDWQTAYRMHLAALDGNLTPLAFMQQTASTGVKVLSYKITNVTIPQPDKAFVEAAVTYEVPQLFKPYRAPLKTEWVLRDGQLYRVAEKVKGGTGSAIKDMLD